MTIFFRDKYVQFSFREIDIALGDESICFLVCPPPNGGRSYFRYAYGSILQEIYRYARERHKGKGNA